MIIKNNTKKNENKFNILYFKKKIYIYIYKILNLKLYMSVRQKVRNMIKN